MKNCSRKECSIWRVFHGCGRGHSFHTACLLPNIGSCPICKGVLKKFVEDLSEKANNSVLNPDVYGDSDDEDKCEMGGDDENSVEGDDEADQDSYFGEAEHGCIESLIDDILRWKRPSLSSVAIK